MQIISSLDIPLLLNTLNELGLNDMGGDVYEWVEDCYNEDYTGAPADAAAWLNEKC